MNVPRACIQSIESCVRETRRATDLIRATTKRCLDFDPIERAEDLLRGLDDVSDAICQAIDTSEFLRSAHVDTKHRDIAYSCVQELQKSIHLLNTNGDLYRRLVRLRNDQEAWTKLGQEDKRLTSTLISDFEANGIHLPESTLKKVRDLQHTIGLAGDAFCGNVVSNTNYAEISASGVDALPANLRRHVLETNTRRSVLETDRLRIPAAAPFSNVALQSLPSSDDRQHVYEAAYDCPRNEDELETLLSARKRLACLTGHKSYAHLTMASNAIAQSPEDVDTFLCSLATELQPKLREEMELLREEKTMQEGRSDVSLWDEAYYKPRVQMSRYQVQHNEIKSYFSLDTVLNGLCALTERVFSVSMSEVPVDPNESWSPSIRKFTCRDKRSDVALGDVYLDLFARPGKPRGAAHYTFRGSRTMPNGKRQKPIVAISCGFSSTSSSPQCAASSPLGVWACDTLIHEFGHALHAVLSNTTYQHLSGTRVATDIVEIPAMLLTKFFWDPRTMYLFSRHVDSGDRVPVELARDVVNAERAFLGFDRVVTATHALLDLRLHRETYEPRSASRLLSDIQRYYLCDIGQPERVGWHTQFTHLVSYPAGYYTYLLGEAYATLLWKEYFAVDPLRVDGGCVYRDTFLSVGNANAIETMIPKGLSLEDAARCLVDDVLQTR